MKLTQLKNKITYFLGICIFAGIGAYIVFLTSAAQNFNGNGSIDGPGLHGWPSLNVGDQFTMASRGGVYAPIRPYQILIDFRYNPSVAKLSNIKCETSLGCYRSNSPGYIDRDDSGNVVTSYNFKTGFVVCIDAKNTEVNNLTFFSMSFTKLTTAYDVGYGLPGHLSWYMTKFGAAPGSCNNNRTGSGVEWFSGTGGSCNTKSQVTGGGFANDIPCDHGEGIGNTGFTGFSGFTDGGTGNTGTGHSGNGNGNQDTGNSGGGRGGSSANQQGNAPNTIPSSSTHGDKEQPDLEPSPFYDGKKFEKGSNADILGNTVASTGKKIVRTWPIVLGVLILGGAAGFGYWKWRRVRS